MKAIKFLLLLTLCLSACSVNVSTPAPSPTAAESIPTMHPPPSPVLATPTLAPATPFTVPITWDKLQLTGKLVFAAGPGGIVQLDLTSGEMTTLFQLADPQNSWVQSEWVSPDATQIAIAYAPPPPPGGIQFGYTNLYLVPMDGSGQAQPVFPEPEPNEAYFNPIWSPDGKYIYVLHLVPPPSQTERPSYAIERLAYPLEQPEPKKEVLVENGFWPRLSPDGTKLAYVLWDVTKPPNELFVADADGKNATQIALPKSIVAVDAPFFSPDGQYLIFSVINNTGIAQRSWLDRVLEVQIAYADGSPADFWRVPVVGGEPEQLTRVFDTSLYGVFSPDGQHIVYCSGSGLSVMNADGTGVTSVLTPDRIPGMFGASTVNWIP